ncbi:hypothetical protein [Mycobacteroides abscessus]|uniref:hypothetical protein n=1 Tax=Mycobacteroides abscessus TaxID=36809 RepID=UPI00177EE1B0|nr:hypothetical protein [Mycobacteroides abscessus]QOF29690.1 hypothetical protein E3G43_003250 [Mycobacteroides abscessus]
MRRLDKVVRDPDVRHNPLYGPALDDHCPCGSRRQTQRCHRAPDYSWVAERPAALITGPRTGYANPGCYARLSNDCDDQLTLEHWISDDLLERISADKKVVALQGASWQPSSEKKTVGIKGVSTRMLCERHNKALSPLDSVAAEFFAYLRDDLVDMTWHEGVADFARGFTMVSGPHLELWLLKALWGAIEAKALVVNGHRAYRFRLGVTNDVLAEILWRGAEWPKHWGMYVLLDRDHDVPVIPNSVRVRLASMGSEVLGGFFEIGGFEFLISFELPPVRRIYRPAALTFQRAGFRSCYKMAAFAWPETGHEMVNVWSQRGPNESVRVPPSARAVGLAEQTFPGSFTITSGAE